MSEMTELLCRIAVAMVPPIAAFNGLRVWRRRLIREATPAELFQRLFDQRHPEQEQTEAGRQLPDRVNHGSFPSPGEYLRCEYQHSAERDY